MERTRLTTKEKLNNATEWLWEYACAFYDSELQYAGILYDIGYTFEEIEEELRVNLGMNDREIEKAIFWVKEYNGLNEV